MKNHLLLLLVSILTGHASAAWESIHLTSSQNSFVSYVDVASLNQPLHWKTIDEDLNEGIRPINTSNTVFGVVTDDGGTSGFGEIDDDSIRLRAYDIRTGYRIWETEELDAGASVGNGSLSAPLVNVESVEGGDTFREFLFFASGNSLHKFDVRDGSLIWSTTFGPDNTDPNAAFGIVNSSPSTLPNSNMILIQTSDFGLNPSQTIAVNSVTGEVEWHYTNGGRGAFSPVIYSIPPTEEDITTKLCVVDTYTSEGAGLMALDINTGEPFWDHRTVSEPWALPGGHFVGFWTEPVFYYRNQRIYAVSYDFSPNGELAEIDSITGELLRKAPSVGTDIPPIVGDGNGHLYLLGGEFDNADLQIFSVNDIADDPIVVNTGSGFFRNYMAGTLQGYLVAQEGIGLTLRDSKGMILESAPALSGVPSVDIGGGILAYQDGSLVRLRHPGGNVLADSDFDGLPDFAENYLGTSNFHKDSDLDGWWDSIEYLYLMSDPTNSIDPGNQADADGDGLPDSIDDYPELLDGNGNGISDHFEVALRYWPYSKPRLGDIDGNGHIDNVDAVLMMEALLGERDDVIIDPNHFDTNLNGTLDSEDAKGILEFFIGNIELLPAEPFVYTGPDESFRTKTGME